MITEEFASCMEGWCLVYEWICLHTWNFLHSLKSVSLFAWWSLRLTNHRILKLPILSYKIGDIVAFHRTSLYLINNEQGPCSWIHFKSIWLNSFFALVRWHFYNIQKCQPVMNPKLNQRKWTDILQVEISYVLSVWFGTLYHLTYDKQLVLKFLKKWGDFQICTKDHLSFIAIWIWV